MNLMSYLERAKSLDRLTGPIQRVARRLVLAGLAASVPATLAGAADWSEQHEQQMRVGLVHAAANTAAIALYAASTAVPARAARTSTSSRTGAVTCPGRCPTASMRTAA